MRIMALTFEHICNAHWIELCDEKQVLNKTLSDIASDIGVKSVLLKTNMIKELPNSNASLNDIVNGITSI